MRLSRLVSFVAGILIIVPAVAMLLGGGLLGLGYTFGRDADGYFDSTIRRIETASTAITATDIDFMADPAGSDWFIRRLDADIRLIAESSEKEMFVGIAPSDEVDRYLTGVAHNEINELDDSGDPVFSKYSGSSAPEPPTEQTFWEVRALGATPLELNWPVERGSWSVVLMNADASPGILADVNVGAKAGFILPLALTLMGVGAVLTPVGLALILHGTAGGRAPTRVSADAPSAPATLERHPVLLEAGLDPHLSQWKWLIKWALAIPHALALIVLWAMFVVLTVIAGVMILITGRYPSGIFDFNVGVLRWTWRVTHYASTGGLGTDRYPPFSISAQAGDRATLDIVYPERLSRRLVLFKWWLLALPHYLIVGFFVGDLGWTNRDGVNFSGISLLGVLCVVAGFSLLLTGKYPRPLFDLIVGLNRWVYRVVAYAALMTDVYPPFRLDQGGEELASQAPTPEPELVLDPERSDLTPNAMVP